MLSCQYEPKSLNVSCTLLILLWRINAALKDKGGPNLLGTPKVSECRLGHEKHVIQSDHTEV